MPYVPHWSAVADGGGGHCFPAGHASAGFAFIGGYFVIPERRPRTARIWLQDSLASGLLLGLAQQLRGAHFMSHTRRAALEARVTTVFSVYCVPIRAGHVGQEPKERRLTLFELLGRIH